MMTMIRPDAVLPAASLIAVAAKYSHLERSFGNVCRHQLPGGSSYECVERHEFDNVGDLIEELGLAVKCLLQAADLPDVDSEEMDRLIKAWRARL